jgi:undecaprenyl-diphosphatase
VLEALLLGLLQGISEFLPISSSGHLALAGMLFGIKDAGLTLNVLLHVGTLVATIVVLRERLYQALVAGFRALVKPSLFTTDRGGQDALFVVVASIPTALIGLLLRDDVDRWTRAPLVVGLGFLVTSALLVSTRFARPGAIEHPSVKMALLLGMAQGAAVLPGISRSGTTIAVALFLGVQRGRAFELSMLMSIPAVLGAALLELPGALDSFSSWVPGMAGALVACVSGVFAMLVLRRMVVSGSFPWFAIWVFPLAVATLVMARAWPH